MTVKQTEHTLSYLKAHRLGQCAFYEGHPKVYPGTEDGYIRSAWHEGWFDAWKRNALGEFTLIQGGKS